MIVFAAIVVILKFLNPQPCLILSKAGAGEGEILANPELSSR